MVVREEDLAQLDQADGRDEQLTLGALSAVDEQALPAPANEQRRRPALSRGHRAGGAEKHDVQIHGAIVESPP